MKVEVGAVDKPFPSSSNHPPAQQNLIGTPIHGTCSVLLTWSPPLAEGKTAFMHALEYRVEIRSQAKVNLSAYACLHEHDFRFHACRPLDHGAQLYLPPKTPSRAWSQTFDRTPSTR